MNAENKNLPVVISRLAVNGDLIKRQIKAIGGMAGVLDDKLHATLVASYAHAMPPTRGGHGDCRYLTSLLCAAGKSKSLRVKQMVSYLQEAAPFKVSFNETDNTYAVAYKKNYNPSQFKDAEELLRNPFYKAEERTAYVFDLVGSLDKMLATANRQLKHIEEKNALDQVWTKQVKDALLLLEGVKNHAITVTAEQAKL